jgi:hypothetical protein
MSTRRLFVKVGTISGVAALLPNALGAESREGAMGTRSAGTRGRFASQIGRTFLVENDAGARVPLVLATVSDPAVLGAPGLEGHPECFSAAFLGPASAPLRQGTYAVSNDGLGRLALFLVPTGRPQGGAQHYEAAFNCVIPA